MNSNSENTVQSLDRALDIIEVLATEHDGLGLTEIAARVRLHKSTAQRLVNTMARRKYLEKTQEGKYRLGLNLINTVSMFINSVELQTEARPYLAQINTDLGLTSHLGVLDGDQVVYVEKMDIFSNAKVYAQIGLRVHAYCSSLGKCLLSNYSSEQLAEVMKDCSFIRFTVNTIGTLEELTKEMAKVRKSGWAMDNQEFEIGHRCIAAPVYDYKGDIIAAISASGNINVLRDDRIEEVAAYVKGAAKDISASMGYVG